MDFQALGAPKSCSQDRQLSLGSCMSAALPSHSRGSSQPES
ncbi:hypothetical protein E2320_009336, partial [Naja naja]